MKKIIAAAFATIVMAGPVFADSEIQAIPTAWRLQNYVGGKVFVYFTGASCPSGNLVMNGSADESNRFWSTVLSAKLSGKPMGVFYDPSSCGITSFYMMEQ